VATAEQGHERQLDRITLADDHALDVASQGAELGRCLLFRHGVLSSSSSGGWFGR